ncbi:hypothetical protein TWF703_006188 [Orbilia oligospora]|uniref:DH domain-containing protein n=1 Tax=Orbilia oligospora TaxID=2813651 RepID=A0A7C8JZB9_ORBOL|nr:hypothetical protein TWF703_006188 [Orbilia oligospora]
MARVSPQLPNLGRNHQIFVSPPEPLLTQVVIFFLPYSGTSSRVDAHIYTACGFVSYSRMTVDPSSAVYQAVNFMPIEKTESEIYRALAFALCRYFVELTVGIKGTASATAKVARSAKPEPFSAAHAGELAAKLVRIEDDHAISSILAALTPRYIPSIDIDLVLPQPGTFQLSKYQRLLQFVGDVHKQDTNLKRRPSRVERTRPKSIVSLPQSNPEKVAIKLQELLDTEVNYIDKLQKIISDVVKPERQIAESAGAPEPNEAALARLFPSYLDEILQLNSKFLDELTKAMDDDDGVTGVAEVFLRHFPNFHNPYSHYIALNPASSGLIGELMRGGTAFSQRLAGYGEQYLKSTLMEPIQRLPRYTLIIDGVINNIAVTSPISSKLIEARDIVSKTCEMQSAPAQERAQTIARLSHLISGWPTNFKPGGPLVTAVDLTEVAAPYTDAAEKTNVILLVFTDSIAFINRPGSGSMKAQGVLTEITMPPSIQNSFRRDAADLHFAGCTSLKYNRYSTSDNGRAMWITLTKDLEEVYDMRESAVGMKKFLPSGPWEGKANELVEEIIQAQLQSKSRVQEIRWSGNSNSKFDALELWTSVYEPRNYELEKSPSRALIQMGVETPSFDIRTKTPEISATINFINSGKIRIDILDMGKIAFTETVGELDILTVITKRISSILDRQSHTSHPPISAAMIQGHRRIIRSLNLSAPDSDSHHSKFKTFRPPSPVKLLHTFLGSSNVSPGKSPFKATSFESTTEMARPTVLLERPHSVLYRADGSSAAPVEDAAIRMKDISLVENHPQQGDSYHKQLERVLDAFVSVLDGKLSKEVQPGFTYSRKSSNSHVVDQLLKAMLTDSSKTAAAQAAGVDIVLNSFEKFLQGKWREAMGTLLSQETVKDLQSKLDSLHPDDFSKYFKDFLENLGPQNKRGFNKITTLFSRSIHRASTDEAKNSLRTVFTEILIASGLTSSKISEVAKLHAELLLYMLNYIETINMLNSKFHKFPTEVCDEEDILLPLPRHSTYYQDCYEVEKLDHEPMKRPPTVSRIPELFRTCSLNPVKKSLFERKDSIQRGQEPDRSPSPTRGRPPFKTSSSMDPLQRGSGFESSESESSVSPVRSDKRAMDMLKEGWQTAKQLTRSYSPTKPPFTGYSEANSSTPHTPAQDNGVLKRSKTTGTYGANASGATGIPTVVPLSSSSSLRKRFGLSNTGSEVGESPSATTSEKGTNGTAANSGYGSLSKSSVKSMLRQRSNRSGKEKEKEKEKDTLLTTPTKLGNLHRSQSTDTDIRRDFYERDVIPRPMSRDSGPKIGSPAMPERSAGPTLVIPKNTGANTPSANPLSPIVASPVAEPTSRNASSASNNITAEGSPLPALRRKKRRSSLSDLVAAKDLLDADGEEATDYDDLPPIAGLDISPKRKDSVDRKENVHSSVGSMGPPPVPTHAKNASLGGTRDRIIGNPAPPAMYMDNIAPLNVSGVRMNRAHSDAGSTNSTKTKSSTTGSTTQTKPDLERTGSTGSRVSAGGNNSRLSNRLTGEKMNVSKVSGTLEQELALIGQELLAKSSSKRNSGAGSTITKTETKSIVGNHNESRLSRGGSSGSTGGASSASADEGIRRKLRLMESKLNSTVNDLNKRYENLSKETHAALAKEIKRNQEVERMWQDERNENDAVYNKFNEALEKCVKGLQGQADEDRVGLVRMLVQSQEEVGKLRAEVVALKKENINLRHGRLTEL